MTIIVTKNGFQELSMNELETLDGSECLTDNGSLGTAVGSSILFRGAVFGFIVNGVFKRF